jgi:phosphoglycolate phosphatase-like HAD superfamily hydrolase
MIKNIIFDWSGVIKDSVEDHLFSVNLIFKEFGAQEMTLEELKENWVQPHMDFYNKFLPEVSSEQQEVIYRKAITQRVPKPYPGVADLIRDLKLHDFKMVVISSDLLETVTPEVISFGLENNFLEIAANVYDKEKTVAELIKKYNFDKYETVIVGDSNHELEVGKNIGIKTVATTWGFTTEKRLSTLHPDLIVHNLYDLRDAFFKL